MPPRIDRELGDGDEPGFGDGAVTVAVPGHTPGSIALWLPRHRVLFAGDAAARGPDGTVTCGVFNVSRTQAAASFRRWLASAPNSPASATASRSPTEPQPHCEPPP